MAEIKLCPKCNQELIKPTNYSWYKCFNPNCIIKSIRFNLWCKECQERHGIEFYRKKWIQEEDKKRRGKHRHKYVIEALERANHICKRCGGKDRLEVHHKIPIFHGGTNEEENLIVLCKECHKISHK